jgi:RNA polymerase sigma-70 factor (ECF subfamily)
MNDQTTAAATHLEVFRPYLSLLARLQLHTHLQRKLDVSDLVQQTMLQALAGLEGFRGSTDAEIAVWLRKILARQMANVARDLGRQKRDLSRQCSLQAALDDSAARLEQFLTADQSSPSEKVQRSEQAVRLADAIAALPEAQREAVVLHHFDDWTLEQVGRHLERSPVAVAGLIKRALRSLRLRLQEPP